MAWYNTYRPQNFEEVIGQDLVKTVLQNAILKNRVKHAYLLSGSKGIGKTTLARLFAKKLNQIEQNPQATLDIIEMDAASNTGIDDIRQLIESAKTPPMAGDHKVYIIDEVHMLSKAAMNALLKILEEPPKYLVFLLATTNPEKLIPTVLSRVTHLRLQNHSRANILQMLTRVSQAENLIIDQPSLELIASRSQGSQRDALTLLETIAGYDLDRHTLESTTKLLGLLPAEILERLTSWSLGGSDPTLIVDIEATGMDGYSLINQYLEYLLDQSFAGRVQVNEIIPKLGNLIDQNLPINTTTQALALIQVYTGRIESQPATDQIQPTQTPPNQAKPDNLQSLQETVSHYQTDQVQPASDQKTKTKAQKSTTKTPDKQTETPADAVFVDTQTESAQVFIQEDQADHQEVSSPADQDMQEIQDKLQTLSLVKNCPPSWKMVVSDVRTDKLDNGVLYLSVSSGVFLGQLNSPKMLSWLEQQLNQGLAQPFKVKFGVRGSLVDSPLGSTGDDTPATTAPKPQSTTSKSEPIEVQQDKPTKSERPSPKKSAGQARDEKYFYSVYKQLPPELADSSMPVRAEDIPTPNSQSHTDEVDWDEHASQLFDFE